MFELDQFPPFLLLIIPFLLLVNKILSQSQSSSSHFPKSYPLVGSFFAYRKHKKDLLNWISTILNSSPSATFTFHRPFGQRQVFIANPANVEYILKTRFLNYQKGSVFSSVLEDLLGHGIFNVDGYEWKFQRQVASHEFNTKSLRKFVEQVVDAELNDRLIPFLSNAAKKGTVLDVQDILKRFAFDNICQIAFGYDPEYLTPSLPQARFAVAFEGAVMMISQRFRAFFPIIWKLKRFLNIGSERELKKAVSEVREFGRTLVRQKKKELDNLKGNSLPESNLDLLSRFLVSGHLDEKFVTDIVISFIVAGRDTTSAALTWFFWLLSENPRVEDEILKEINGGSSDSEQQHSVFDEVRHSVYTHASICESMRLYPPVPVDSKEAVSDDVLPDGTMVKKGMRVTYHPYAMGRSEKLWGKDWPEFRPERWLERETTAQVEDGKWRFVGRDPYSYPVFQAGPRICLGKELAFLQMKMVVGGVLRRFRVVPAVEDGFQPALLPGLTLMMRGGLPVRFEERNGSQFKNVVGSSCRNLASEGCD
ncbi:hypothetical protein Ancab_020202 [Ancistrocladus abbreviatus]